jgi:uncharacterized protein (TIGR03067 family)
MLWIIEGETIWLVPSWLAERERRASPKDTKPVRASPNQDKGAVTAGKSAAVFRGPRMTYRLDPARSPKHIDIEGLGKSASFGVYKLDGDELTVCMGVSQASPVYDKRAKSDESTRPTTINPEAGTVIILKKVK